MFKESVPKRRWRQLEDLFHAGIFGDSTDGELLDRFLRDRDSVGEAAFRALVERHGPMVYRVCRQVLEDHHAAQDAVQVTFLVLARQAGTIRNGPSVASWLFGVARRASARIRMDDARRHRHELRLIERAPASIALHQDLADPDPYPELHAEIARLPDKYRAPIVLCYLEGLTHEQAANRLGWPLGTVKTRLARARARLQSRLEHQGVASPLSILASPLRPGNLAVLSEALVHTITQTSCRSATNGVAAALVSSTVIKVTREVTRTMLVDKLKMSALLVCGPALLGFGVLVAGQQMPGKGDSGPPTGAPIADRTASPFKLKLDGTTAYDPATVTSVRVPFDSRVDRVYAELGANVKIGDPLVELFSKKARYTVRSPVNGVVVARSVVTGNFYTPIDALLTIASLDHLWVWGIVNETDAARVKLGQKLKVIVPLSDQTIDGTVTYVSGNVDAESRLVRFRTAIPNPERRLKGGMFVRLELDAEAARDKNEERKRSNDPPLDAAASERLTELERKVDRLLSENQERAARQRILERLDSLERKLDRLSGASKDSR